MLKTKRLSNRTFLMALLAIQVLFLYGKIYITLILIETIKVLAITEDENEISLRDANSSKERPKLDAYDFDEDTQKEIEVKIQILLISCL